MKLDPGLVETRLTIQGRFREIAQAYAPAEPEVGSQTEVYETDGDPRDELEKCEVDVAEPV